MGFDPMALTTRQFAGAVLVASAAVLGAALLSQYWGGLAPCELCLLQRWPWWVAIAIATHHGQRCSRQSSHGASPPQYCDSSAAPSTAALATSTAPANCLVVRAIGSKPIGSKP